MLMADDNPDFWSTVDFSTSEDQDNFSIDIDSLYAILSEDLDPSQNYSLNSSEDLLCKDSFQGEAAPVEVNHVRSSQTQNGIQEYKEAPPMGVGVSGSSLWYSSDYSEFSDSRTGMDLDGWFGFPENPIFDNGKPPHIASPVNSCSASLAHWLPVSYAEHDTCSSERVGGSMNAPLYCNTDIKTIPSDMPNCSTAFNFSAGEDNKATGCTDHLSLIPLKSENKEFWHVGDLYSKCASHQTMMEKSGLPFGNYGDVIGNSMEDLGGLERSPCTSTVEASLPNGSNHDSDIHCEPGNHCPPEPFCGYSSMIANPSRQCLHDTFDLPLMPIKEEKMIYIKDEVKDQVLVSHNIYTNGKTNLAVETVTGLSDLEASTVDSTDINYYPGKGIKCEASAYCSPIGINSSRGVDDGPLADDPTRKLFPDIQSFASSNKELDCKEDAREDQVCASKSVCCNSVNVIDEAVGGADRGLSSNRASSNLLSSTQSVTSSKKLRVKAERNDKLIPSSSMSSDSLKETGEVVQSNPSVYKSHVDDDDADICILEDISHPRHPPPAVVHGKTIVSSQRSVSSDPVYHTGVGGTRLKRNEESLTLRVALQDLSQPKSEASLQDGVLAVPLLKHQRIALSWMVQKETASLHCSGGILADDQGLGKTISTIALILKERPSSSKVSSMVVKQDESKTLNLDQDDFGGSEVLQLDAINKDEDSGNIVVNKSLAKSENAYMLARGRPAAGTLVVCPTSVLRQWADELHNKVTREANLSTLVYHGSNRTKDPFELAKYDVVLTTYSIVSMEVPKQPLVDKDEDGKGKPEGHGLPPMELSSSRKRKYPPNSDKKNRKDKKGMDGALLESSARPLARVGWFRVVLDEAQSIKNHRTQAARACWGLRAKRRWCLSGTPIQNAVDDLYSYFRFLRYDPYAVYKSFCSMIKVPINRNPTTGYRKLQAVLKTIMLRRTKGTLINGEPVITLPPKTVELKKVDFSKEERDFYSKLEADSRAQFNAYAASGTVKQNYVNILLMLLRLRQACDHPHLVKGYDSNSVWRSSVEMAKRLPREKQIGLLNLLEACLEICAICNDPPEDAAVTICGHVFCNQCICEHLTGDDNLCPVSQCKVHLSVTSVFSSATLKSSLSDQPDSSTCLVEKLEPCPESLSNSSKIKAALEVLHSLSKPWDGTSKDSSLNSVDEVARCPGNTSDCRSVGACKDFPEEIHVNSKKVSEDSSTKVSEKALVFSQWTRMLDLLEAHLKNSSIQYRRLDGTMSVVARDKAVKDFNTLPEVTVMIMSLKAASLGLNMVAACRVVLLDLWWNPTTEDQAIDRAHRIGQTRPVTVLRLTVKDTVEDRILALQQKKREMVSSAFGEDETGSRQTRLTVDDLKYLFMV